MSIVKLYNLCYLLKGEFLLAPSIYYDKYIYSTSTRPGEGAIYRYLSRQGKIAGDIHEGKRYVPEKEYIHMISSYITADWSNIE